ncbi:DUF7149 domain-containing protein [Solitalea lacus]|uniref:DUF7149 domain-containing protein n=1 Tax=Solitalea lacus TaxID=2911172 RepID=UPI003B8470C3
MLGVLFFYVPQLKIKGTSKPWDDLVIHNGKDAKSSVGVSIEAKSTTNKAEMLKVN